jgi:hypothetical protein
LVPWSSTSSDYLVCRGFQRLECGLSADRKPSAGIAVSRRSAPSTIPLRLGFHYSSDCDPAMTSQPDALLAVEPAHLPHYSHSAVIVGSVIILAIIILVAGVTLAIAHHLVSAGPMPHRDQSLRLHCVEKHEMIGVHLGGDTGARNPAIDWPTTVRGAYPWPLPDLCSVSSSRPSR